MEGIAIVPGHPVRLLLGHRAGVLLQSDQIAERRNAVQLASVDQAHEQVANVGRRDLSLCLLEKAG